MILPFFLLATLLVGLVFADKGQAQPPPLRYRPES